MMIDEQPVTRSSRRPGSRNPSRVSSALWLSILIAVAMALRIVDLGRKSLWLDEAASSLLARSDWHTFVTAMIHREANMVFYYLLLRGWIHLGNSEIALRLLSVLFGVASVPVMYRLAQILFGARTALLAALLLCINVFHIQYSQEARGYALVVFLALLSCYFFVRLLKSSTKTAQAAYILASFLMVYAHVFGAWILLAQWTYALLQTGANRKKMYFDAAIITALVSPLIFTLLFVSDRSQLSWMSVSSTSDLYHFFLNLTGNSGVPLLILYLVLLLISLRFRFPQCQDAHTPAPAAYFFIWIWFLLPILIVGIISLRWPVLQARYLIVCLPPFLILAADGLTRLRSKLIFATALTATAGMSLLGVAAYYKARVDLNHSDNWRDATRYCLSRAQSGDTVLFTYSAEEIPFREYQNRLGASAPNIKFAPQKTDLELLTTPGTWASRALASSTATQNRRVWVITALQPNAHSAEVQAVLKAQLKEESRENFGFVSTELFVSANSETHEAGN